MGKYIKTTHENKNYKTPEKNILYIKATVSVWAVPGRFF
jgi:hypothetical protein